MSVVAVNRPEQQSETVQWARLIPGQSRAFPERIEKEQVALGQRNDFSNSKRTRVQDAAIPQSGLAILKPRPLEGRSADKWIRSTATDWALISLNWLLVGAVLVPLREHFPQVRSFGYAAGTPIYLLGMAMLHAALITLIGYSEGLQIGGRSLRVQKEILAKSIIWATALLCAAYSLQGHPWTVNGLICIAAILHFMALWGSRWCLGAETSGERRNVLIIGATATGQQLANSVAEQPGSRRKVCGFLDDEISPGSSVIGRVSDLARIARREFVDEIIVVGPHDGTRTQWVLNEARKLRLDVEIVPEFVACNPAGEQIERIGDLPVICLHAERLPSFALSVKRVIDVAVATGAAIVLSPILAIISGLIRLDSRGPVLYTAPRAGKKGQLFRCFKFRTMVSNADVLKMHLRKNNQRAGPFFKLSSDPRITRIGRYLRKYSLDELPQLWNVIKGDMSLVGPRPHPLDDIEGYEIEHLARLDVTPGITGLWQVTARRDPSFERGMELDREYIRSWSLRLDAGILLKTIWSVLAGSGE